jgi:hypothetical protein
VQWDFGINQARRFQEWNHWTAVLTNHSVSVCIASGNLYLPWFPAGKRDPGQELRRDDGLIHIWVMGMHCTAVQGWIFMFLEQGVGPHPVELEYRHAFHDLYDDFIVYFGCVVG